LIVLDTSGVLAAIDASERHHQTAADALRASTEPRLLSPFVLAELDYLISTRVSADAARSLLEQVASGAYRLEQIDGADVAAALEIMERYGDFDVSLADASLVVLADRYDTQDVFTLDERHFRVLRGRRDRPFRILPADAN
jgi:uncharacterized protein